MNKLILLILLSVFSANFLKAQEGVLVPKSQIIGEWANPKVVKVDDGFIVASDYYYYTNNGYVIEFSKLDQDGNVIWNRYASLYESERDFRLLKGSEAFYVVGITQSEANDTFVENKKGDEDIYILKFNLEAELQWSRRLGGNGYNILNDAKMTPDGNILIAGGYSFYPNGANYPRSDFYYAIVSPENTVVNETRITDFTDDEPFDEQWIKAIDVNDAGELFAYGWTSYVTGRDESGVSNSGKSVLLKFSESGEILESADVAEDYDFNNQKKGLLQLDNNGEMVVVYPDIEQPGNGEKNKSVLKFSEDLSMKWSKTLDTKGEDDFEYIQVLEDNSILLSGKSNANFGGDVNDINIERGVEQAFITKIKSSGEVDWTKFYETVDEKNEINSFFMGEDKRIYATTAKPLTSLLDSSISMYRKSAIVTFDLSANDSAPKLNEVIDQTGFSACSIYLKWDKVSGTDSRTKYLLKLNDEIVYAGIDTITLANLTENTDYDMELVAVDEYINQSNVVQQSFKSPKNYQANIANVFIPNTSGETRIYDMAIKEDGTKIIVGSKYGNVEDVFTQESYGGGGDGIIFTLSKDNVITNELSLGGSGFDLVSKIEEYEGGYICALLHNSGDVKINGEISNSEKGVTFFNIDMDGNILWQKNIATDPFRSDILVVKTLQIDGDSVSAVMQEFEETSLYKMDLTTGNLRKEVLLNRNSSRSYSFLRYIEKENSVDLHYFVDDSFVVEKRSNGSISNLSTQITSTGSSEADEQVEILNNGNYLLGFSTDATAGPAIDGLNRGKSDIYFVEIDSANGEIIDVYQIGDSEVDYLEDFIITSTGIVKAAIRTVSPKIPATNFINRGEEDMLIVDIDWNSKSIVGSNQYGGNNDDRIRVIKESQAGYFHFGGETRSISCDLIFHTSSSTNMWLIDYRDEKDETPPTAPTNLDTLQHENDYETVLGWEAATDNYGVAFYNVYKNDQLIGQSFNTNLYELRNSDFERESYQFKVTAVDYARLEGEPANLDLDFEIILSVDDFLATRADVNVYPIPVQDKLNIQFPDEMGSDLEFIIYDQYGHQVKSFEGLVFDGNNVELNQLANLNSGVYILRITSSKGSISKRIIKF